MRDATSFRMLAKRGRVCLWVSEDGLFKKCHSDPWSKTHTWSKESVPMCDANGKLCIPWAGKMVPLEFAIALAWLKRPRMCRSVVEIEEGAGCYADNLQWSSASYRGRNVVSIAKPSTKRANEAFHLLSDVEDASDVAMMMSVSEDTVWRYVCECILDHSQSIGNLIHVIRSCNPPCVWKAMFEMHKQDHPRLGQSLTNLCKHVDMTLDAETFSEWVRCDSRMNRIRCMRLVLSNMAS